jgi:hypothetical protein
MTLDRELTPFEAEVGRTMTERRDAALRLTAVLAHDVADYESGMATVRAGRALDILQSSAAGQVRQGVSDAIAEFEGARHRFRLALIAVAVDNGMTARQIGDAFTFSRQLASRYLKEAREKWPDLEHHEDDMDLDGDGTDPVTG